MPAKPQPSRARWERLRTSTALLTFGGDWALSLPTWAKRNLSWFWLDGFFAAACDNIAATYLVLYILMLGATPAQIGFMSSLSSLLAALLLLPGAVLVERIGYRKQIILTGGGFARFALVLLAALPLIKGTQSLVYLAIALSVSRDAMNNLIYPAWMSLTGDIVPLAGRGRYFSSRNFIIGVAGMATTLLFGQVISSSSLPLGYQITLISAFLLGISSTFSFSRIRDPNAAAPVHRSSPIAFKKMLGEMSVLPGFMVLIGTTALWNFSLNVPGPFFTVYLVQNLGAGAFMVGLTSIASSLAALLVQPRLGTLADRWGARRMQMISGLLIPIVPVAWAFAHAAWNVILINLVSGALWAAFNLASFNYLLALIPEAKRARFSAIYQVVVMLSLSLGAAAGGFLVTHYGYPVIFWGSGIGRLVAALIFARYALTLPEPIAQASKA